MKKLLLDSCTKTTFSYDNVIYQQNEDVHLLDLKIMNNGEINIFVKDTNSGLYIITAAINHGTQKMHGLGHFMTELIKYLRTTICSINKYHTLER